MDAESAMLVRTGRHVDLASFAAVVLMVEWGRIAAYAAVVPMENFDEVAFCVYPALMENWRANAWIALHVLTENAKIFVASASAASMGKWDIVVPFVMLVHMAG